MDDSAPSKATCTLNSRLSTPQLMYPVSSDDGPATARHADVSSMQAKPPARPKATQAARWPSTTPRLAMRAGSGWSSAEQTRHGSTASPNPAARIPLTVGGPHAPSAQRPSSNRVARGLMSTVPARKRVAARARHEHVLHAFGTAVPGYVRRCSSGRSSGRSSHSVHGSGRHTVLVSLASIGPPFRSRGGRCS